MSDQLFLASDWRRPVPAFASARASRPGWLQEVQSVLDEDWGEIRQDNLATFLRRVDERSPDLIVACESDLADILIDQTKAPVWYVRDDQAGPQWLSLRRLRCHARGLRATEWARNLAQSLGAELEFSRTWHNPDMAVLSRNWWRTRSLVAARSPRPLVMV